MNMYQSLFPLRQRSHSGVLTRSLRSLLVTKRVINTRSFFNNSLTRFPVPSDPFIEESEASEPENDAESTDNELSHSNDDTGEDAEDLDGSLDESDGSGNSEGRNLTVAEKRFGEEVSFDIKAARCAEVNVIYLARSLVGWRRQTTRQSGAGELHHPWATHHSL